ncbi:MAG: hypothetical protein LBT13_06275, partial [Treponema sp.]|nr:hypothetical protein [Treponema sp.]
MKSAGKAKSQKTAPSVTEDAPGTAESTSDTRAATLERLITAYQASYYNGEAEISDGEFDLLWDELQRLKPDSPVLARVGADNTDGFPKA